MVEFALILVPLLLILVGMLQLGVLFNAKIDGTHITATGARYAAVNQNPSDLTLPAYIKSKADTADLRTESEICIDFPENAETGTSGEVGDPVRVTMTYEYGLVPFLGERLAPAVTSITVTADATMRLEAVPVDIDAECA